MARNTLPRRRLFRRTVVFGVVVAVGVGGLVLERTATGATTGKPSKSHHTSTTKKYTTTTKRHTTTTKKQVTTTTKRYVTTTTRKPHNPPVYRHCHKVWVYDKHHRKVKKWKCRAPSGGYGPGH